MFDAIEFPLGPTEADLHSLESRAMPDHAGDEHQQMLSSGHSIFGSVIESVMTEVVHMGEKFGLLEGTADVHLWHEQNHPDTCAIVSQQFVLESLTGHHFTEEALRQEAYERGWYTPGGGTPMGHVGDLLESHGIHVERGEGFNVHDLQTQLASGHKVIVGVNAEDIWNPHQESFVEKLLSEVGFMPGQHADHAVQVVGIDKSDASHPVILLNDSGIPNGAGERVPLDVFEHAWSASAHFMVHTRTA